MGWVSSSKSGAPKSSSAGGSPSSPASSGSIKPGIFAPKGEKLLYEALFENHPELLERVAAEHPDYALVAEALAGFQLGDNERRIELLSRVFETGKNPSLEPFFQRYIPRTSVTVEIAAGVAANLPLNRDAVGLTLAELYQAAGRPRAATDVVEQLEPSSYAAVSLSELYSQLGQQDEVMKLTEGIKNEDDSTALLLVFRGIALREQGMNDGALEAFKEALRLRSRPPEIRHVAMFERAMTYRAMNRKALARKDLERIIAADSHFPSAREALEELSS